MCIKYIFAVFLLCANLIAEVELQKPDVGLENEISRIDAELKSLRDLKERLRISSQKDANDALRWQFQKETYADARRTWEKVENERQKIQEIDNQMQELEIRKKNLLLEHGQKKSP